MTSMLEKIISEKKDEIIKRIDDALRESTVIRPEDFNKRNIIGSILQVIANELRVNSVSLMEYRLVPNFGARINNIDNGNFLNYERLIEIAKSVDPELSNHKKLNEHPMFYMQDTAAWRRPGSWFYEENEKFELYEGYFYQARGPPWCVIKNKKSIVVCKDKEYMKKVYEDDIKSRRLKSIDELLDIFRDEFVKYLKTKNLSIEKDEEGEIKGFWRDYAAVLTPITANDKNEKVVLGFVTFSDIEDWDYTPLSDEALKTLEDIVNKIAPVICYASVAHQLKNTLTELKEAQATIVEQEKMITEQSMAGGFAHEIRNALSPISTYAAILLGSGSRKGLIDSLGISDEEKEQFRERILKMKNQNEYALDITSMIMNYAKIESQKSYEEIRIKPLLEEIVDSHADEFVERQISFKQSLNYDGIIYSNPTQIRQVVDNLIINSEHAVEKTDKKDISLTLDYMKEPDGRYSRGNAVRISVYDSGCGIEDSVKDKIFRPFFTTRPDKKGAGLGLATSRRIARLYEGDIVFESSPGNTVFTLYLPVGEKKDAEAKRDER